MVHVRVYASNPMMVFFVDVGHAMGHTVRAGVVCGLFVCTYSNVKEINEPVFRFGV